MTEHEHIVGNVYYRFGIAPIGPSGSAQPLVSTWRYDGVFVRDCSSASCDTPFHFMQFTCLPENSSKSITREPERAYIPSRVHASMAMFTWDEFIEMVNDPLQFDDPDSTQDGAS